MRKYRFFFHYNKPLSKSIGEHRWSVHFRGTCFSTEHIDCEVTTESKVNKQQPYVVMQGFANKLEVTDKGILIRNL